MIIGLTLFNTNLDGTDRFQGSMPHNKMAVKSQHTVVIHIITKVYHDNRFNIVFMQNRRQGPILGHNLTRHKCSPGPLGAPWAPPAPLELPQGFPGAPPGLPEGSPRAPPGLPRSSENNHSLMLPLRGSAGAAKRLQCMYVCMYVCTYV